MKELASPRTTEFIRKIEDIVLELDHAISSGTIESEEFDRLKRQFRKAAALLEQDAQHEDSRFYIIDEAAGLLYWISGQKQAAKESIRDAVARKKDTQLTSQAARGLAASLKVSKSHEDEFENDTRGSPVRGWLGFFYLTVMLVTLCFGLLAVASTLGIFTSTAGTEQVFGSVISWVLFALPMSYLVLALRRSRWSRTVAIALFTLLTTGCAVIFAAIAAFGGPSGDSGASAFLAFLAFLIFCGTATTAYYIRSSRVRSVFNR